MSSVLQMRSVFQRDRHLDLSLPPDFPEGEIEITVRSAASETAPANGISQQGISDLNDLFSYLDQLPPGTRSKEEIDRYVADERASWD